MLSLCSRNWCCNLLRFLHDLLRSPEGKKCMRGGAGATLLHLLYYLLDFYVSHFLHCRPAISCLLSPPFGTSLTIRPISASCYNLMSSVRTMPSSAVPHVKSRCPQYPGSKIKRFPVPDDKVDWSQSWPQYNPVSYTSLSVLKKPAWADPDIGWATQTYWSTQVMDCVSNEFYIW